ncbi:MAG: hypothetical protein QWI36_01495 [Wolbachia endosymbiont of Tyrophagus putrescentiae]|nr:hypothetical protein [Wolbachia endosymbiont of Tyrophagus putrescentiae]
MSNDKLLITELLSGRLLHDLAGSMGGIMFGLEELEFGNQEEALSLIKESFNDLLAKYKLMRQAYSISDDNLSFEQTKSNIENYLLKRKTKFTLEVSHFDASINCIEKVNKIISSLILTISGTVADIEQISALLNYTENKISLTIKISNEHKPLSRYFVDQLTSKSKIDLNTKNINIYLTSLLLEQYNTEIHFICKNNFIEINLSILSDT